MHWLRKTALLLAVLLCFSTILAQATTCSDMVTQALAAVQNVCAGTGRNQACYGNISIQATPRENASFNFERQGDLVDVAAVQSLRLRALDATQNIWGVALMKLQADLPDSLPGQNVTFLLFGDVEIENAVTSSAPTVEVTTTASINIRTLPSTTGAIAGSLASGETTLANGRNAASDWLRIRIPETDSFGWVNASLVSVTGDVAALNVVDSLDSETAYTPMQAFYFRTGVAGDNLGCTQAPPNGLLIQTPEGVGHINLRANDVDISLGSTAYLQAAPSGQLSVNVLQGQGEVRAFGRTVVVPAGSRVAIPLNEDMEAIGEPEDAEPYDLSLLDELPIEVLPEEFEIADPIDEEELLALQAEFEDEQDELAGSLPEDEADLDTAPADEPEDLGEAGDVGGDGVEGDTGGDAGGDTGGDDGGEG